MNATGRTVTGKGIGVAVIDSGVGPAEWLADPVRVVNGPDLSFESM
jgi:serine protease AprX